MSENAIKIAKIPTDELISDLKDTAEDIVICKAALGLGVTEYSGGSVQDRLDANLKIQKVIEAELSRREGLQQSSTEGG